MTRIRWTGMDTKRILKFLLFMAVLIFIGAAIAEWITDLQTTFVDHVNRG